MGRYARASATFEDAPVGNHIAICYRVVDLGTQVGEYQGKENIRNQILISWELPDNLMSDGKPFSISKFYTNSLNEKASLRNDLVSWRTRDFTPEELNNFDLQNIIGKPCMISIIEKDGKSKVGSIAALPKSITPPQLKNKPYCFWIEEWNDSIFNELSDGIKSIILKSNEYKEMNQTKENQLNVDLKDNKLFNDDNLDIPF